MNARRHPRLAASRRRARQPRGWRARLRLAAKRSLAGGIVMLLCAFVVNAEPPSYPDKARLLVDRDAEGKEHPVRTAADWARRRAHVLANMQRVMGPLRDPSRKVPADVQLSEEVKTPRFVRKKLTFAAEKDDRVPAYLFLPLGRRGKRPAVLCLHQTTG